ncbi:MAG: hypothetical protein U9Q03_01515 [Patescibacteria group bacterium]|nr:hypothetical protein [Patescibacteria group bacterium]
MSDELFTIGEKVFISYDETRLYFSLQPGPWDGYHERVRIPSTDDVVLLAHMALEIWELLLSALPSDRHLKVLGFLKITDGVEEYRDYSDVGPGFISRELRKDIVAGKDVDWKYIECILVED